MVTFTDSDDRRSAHLRNRAIQNANAVRQRRATVENPQWAMSRPAHWYQNRENLASIKGTLADRSAVTTDQGEGRNMYQILMNQMKGGDRGARLIDTRGLPDDAYRTGRKIFQDPSKRAGWTTDLRNMVGDVVPRYSRRPNPAAIHVNEYNPFPKAGFGAKWYKDQFPIASGLDSLMGLAEKSPTFNMLTSMFPKKERTPLERDLSWVPEDVGEYDEIPEIPFMDESIDIEETIPEDLGWEYPDDVGGEDVTITDLMGPEPIDVPDEEITETFTDLDDTHAFTEEFDWAKGDYSGVQEYVNLLIGDPDSTWYKMDRDELVEILIKQNRIKEK